MGGRCQGKLRGLRVAFVLEKELRVERQDQMKTKRAIMCTKSYAREIFLAQSRKKQEEGRGTSYKAAKYESTHLDHCSVTSLRAQSCCISIATQIVHKSINYKGKVHLHRAERTTEMARGM